MKVGECGLKKTYTKPEEMLDDIEEYFGHGKQKTIIKFEVKLEGIDAIAFRSLINLQKDDVQIEDITKEIFLEGMKSFCLHIMKEKLK